MFSTKFLVGGAVATGSTITVAVVAKGYGLFDTSASAEGNQDSGTGSESTTLDSTDTTPSESPTPEARPDVPVAKTKQQEIGELIKTKVGEGITVNIKNGDEAETPLNQTTDDKLDKLKEYLTDEIGQKLKTLISSGQKTLIFEKKNGSIWNYLVKKDHIEAWKNTNGGSNVTLSIEDGTKTSLDGLESESLKKLFEALEQNKTLFSNANSAGTSKTIIFKTVDSNWKHIKKAIEDWIETNFTKGELKVKESQEKDISGLTDEVLKKLFDHVQPKTSELIKFKNPTTGEKTTLTFNKTGETFKLLHTKDTIERWVKSVSESKVTLQVWQDGTEQKDLSTLGEQELEKLFESISSDDNKDLFNKKTETVIVFEKDNTEWKHIKKAIKDWITSKNWDETKIKIKKGEEEAKTDISSFKDEDLTKLLKHLQTNESIYSSLVKKPEEGSQAGAGLTLKKKTDNSDWEKVTGN